MSLVEEVLTWIRREDLSLESFHVLNGPNLGIICNDVFAWGCADLEPIGDEGKFHRLAAFVDMVKRDYDETLVDDALIAWIAHERGMRPQGAFLSNKYIDERMLPLFLDAGPVRVIELGNPYSPWTYRMEPEA